MNFLAPAFLAGIVAIAVPVIIHLINRERRVVVEFPSLMFLQRISYKSVRRQKIRHLLLLILRCLALALLVFAFARPFFQRRQSAIGKTGAREVVILLDRSSSMGYGTRWNRARDAAKKVVAAISLAALRALALPALALLRASARWRRLPSMALSVGGCPSRAPAAAALSSAAAAARPSSSACRPSAAAASLSSSASLAAAMAAAAAALARARSRRSRHRQQQKGLTGGDRATLVLFDEEASVATQPMATADRITASINAAKLSAEGTRFGPALKLASQIVGASALPRREVVLISDYQKVGWANHNEVSFPKGTVVTPIDLGSAAAPDVGVTQVTTDRDSTGDRDHITVAARLVNTNKTPAPVTAVLSVGGRDVQSQRALVPASGRLNSRSPSRRSRCPAGRRRGVHSHHG